MIVEDEVSSFFEGTFSHFLSSLSLLLFALVLGLLPALFLAAAAAAALTKAIQSSKKEKMVSKYYKVPKTQTENTCKPSELYLEIFKGNSISFYGYYSKSGKIDLPKFPNKLEALSVGHVDKKEKKPSKKPLYIVFWLYTFLVKLLVVSLL